MIKKRTSRRSWLCTQSTIPFKYEQKYQKGVFEAFPKVKSSAQHFQHASKSKFSCMGNMTSVILTHNRNILILKAATFV